MAGAIDGFKQCYSRAISDPKVLSATKAAAKHPLVGSETGQLRLERRAAALCLHSSGGDTIDRYLEVVSDTTLLPTIRKDPDRLERQAFSIAGGDLYALDHAYDKDH